MRSSRRGMPHSTLWGSKTPTTRCCCQHGSFFELVVLERGLAGVHDDGVELERTPLMQHLERSIMRPQRRVRVPAVQLFFEQLLMMMGKPPGELVLVFDLNQVHGVLLVDLGQGEGV